MNAKILHGLSAFTKLTSSLTALSALAGALPSQYAMPALIVLGVTSTLKDTAIALGDWMDDGKKNGSFKPHVLLILLLPAALTSGMNNAP